MKEIDFTTTTEEDKVIKKIVDRVRRTDKSRDRQSVSMDIIATHKNGCPLDLQKLLEFDDFNFGHDIYGIARHLNRDTGELMHCFLPRSAKHD